MVVNSNSGIDVQDRPHSGASSQRSSPTSNDKIVNKIGREVMFFLIDI